MDEEGYVKWLSSLWLEGARPHIVLVRASMFTAVEPLQEEAMRYIVEGKEWRRNGLGNKKGGRWADNKRRAGPQAGKVLLGRPEDRPSQAETLSKLTTEKSAPKVCRSGAQHFISASDRRLWLLCSHVQQ